MKQKIKFIQFCEFEEFDLNKFEVQIIKFIPYTKTYLIVYREYSLLKRILNKIFG
jgi:hypothetical protein